jgi:hypothetical protein
MVDLIMIRALGVIAGRRSDFIWAVRPSSSADTLKAAPSEHGIGIDQLAVTSIGITSPLWTSLSAIRR